MKRIIPFSFVLLFTMISAVVTAQGKIGYVSVDEIFSLMPETKKADQNLAEYQKALQEAYAEQENDINKALEKFIKDSATMSSAVKEAKRTSLQTEIVQLQNKQSQLNNSLEAEKEKQIKPIREKLIATVKEVAKAMGYEHILFRESAIVFPDAADITNAVKNKLGIK